MMVEIILLIFAILYWLFSSFMVVTLMQDNSKKYTIVSLIYQTLIAIILAPIAAPIIIGIELGAAIKEE